MNKILVTGGRGMVGSAIIRKLEALNHKNILAPNRQELNLLYEKDVENYLRINNPDTVFLAAAKVGGINANINHPVEFLEDNLRINVNLIRASYLTGVKNFIYVASSCIYPKNISGQINEADLLKAPFEPTNEGYAISKVAGLKLLEYYKKEHGFNSLTVVPCNLYGTNDTFDEQKSHVIPALIKKIIAAKENNQPFINIWGSGKALREFMHVDDMVEAVFHLLENYKENDFINVGTGTDISIKDLVHMIAELIGYEGEIRWDPSYPDGMKRKCLNIQKLNATGFKPKYDLKSGLIKTIGEYKKLRTGS